MTFIKTFFVFFLLILCLMTNVTQAKKKKLYKTMVLRQKETNAVNFVRLIVMRLIYGVASRLGFEEQISEALNGAFVPPGVDNDFADYGSFGFLRDDDDDYDYR